MFRRRRSVEDATLTDIYMMLRDLRSEMQTQRAVIGPAMESMAAAFALMVERLEAEREERRALVDALHALTRSMESRDVARPRVVGGSVFAVPANANEEDIVVLEPPEADEVRFTLGDHVRCRFGDSWIEGLEVCEVVNDNGRERYRLRRTVDHYVLPPIFTSNDIRGSELSSETAAPGTTRWSRS